MRLTHETNKTISESRPVLYANVDARSDFPSLPYNQDAVNRVNAVLFSSIMTADTLEFTQADTWSHPKVPRIDALEQDEARNSSDRPWLDIERRPNQTYASLTGVNVMNIVQTANANFTVLYEYMYVDCSLHPGSSTTSNVEVINYLNGLQQAHRLQSGGAFANDDATWATIRDRGFFIYGISDGVSVGKLLYGSFYMAVYTTERATFSCSNAL